MSETSATRSSTFLRCQGCGIEIPPGYGYFAIDLAGPCCMLCHFRLDQTLAAKSPYLEGMVCSFCGKSGKIVLTPNSWNLAPDPTDLSSPRSCMRRLCEDHLNWIIGERLDNARALVATLRFHRSYHVVIGGEAVEVRLPILANKFEYETHFSFDKWVGDRVLIRITSEVKGGFMTAILVRPLIVP